MVEDKGLKPLVSLRRSIFEHDSVLAGDILAKRLYKVESIWD